MRDARNAKRAAEAYLAANAPQRCVVCGKWFVRRAEKVCSDCKRKAEQQAKQVSAK